MVNIVWTTMAIDSYSMGNGGMVATVVMVASSLLVSSGVAKSALAFSLLLAHDLRWVFSESGHAVAKSQPGMWQKRSFPPCILCTAFSCLHSFLLDSNLRQHLPLAKPFFLPVCSLCWHMKFLRIIILVTDGRLADLRAVFFRPICSPRIRPSFRPRW